MSNLTRRNETLKELVLERKESFSKLMAYLERETEWLTAPASTRIYLSKEEVQAVIYHYGQYVKDNDTVAKREEPLTLLLQYAYTWCGFILEKREWSANEL